MGPARKERPNAIVGNRGAGAQIAMSCLVVLQPRLSSRFRAHRLQRRAAAAMGGRPRDALSGPSQSPDTDGQHRGEGPAPWIMKSVPSYAQRTKHSLLTSAWSSSSPSFPSSSLVPIDIIGAYRRLQCARRARRRSSAGLRVERLRARDASPAGRVPRPHAEAGVASNLLVKPGDPKDVIVDAAA